MATKIIKWVRRKLQFKPHPDYSDFPLFPDDFLWGVSTSAYQVEGNITENDWHIFTTSPEIKNRIKFLSSLVTREINLEPAGDAVHHGNIEVLKEDLDRARLLGINTYRFSIEWSRIQPDKGTLDSEALQYYHDAIEEMHKRDLKPIITLNHLSMPKWVLTPPKTDFVVAIEDQEFRDSLRGWENNETVDAFVEFVKIVVKNYKDRVDTWITINEPVATVIGGGYIAGGFPPGFNLDGERAKTAYFNLIKAHVRSYRLIKSIYGDKPSSVGIAHAVMYPKVSSAAIGMTTGAILGIIFGGGIGGNIGLFLIDPPAILWGTVTGIVSGLFIGAIIGGSLDKHKSAKKQFDYFYNFHFLDSLIKGSVDKAIQQSEAKREYEDARTFMGIPLSEQWKPQIDFIGINYYRSVYVYYNKILSIKADFTGGGIDNDLRGTKEKYNLLNDLGWEIYPEGLFYFIKTLNDRYNLPLMITENGIPQRADRNRAPFIVAHLQQLRRGMLAGARVLGYIHWSLLDNWEFLEAYSKDSRFGLFTVNRIIDIKTTGALTYPRHITEGALALQYIIANTGLETASERFGTISPKGNRVEFNNDTRTAGALWEGVLDDSTRFTLYLDCIQNDQQLVPLRFLGMIFYYKEQKWIPLSTISLDGILEFSHEATANVGKRDFQAKAFNGDLSEGTLFEGGTKRTWSAIKLKPYGLWTIISGKPPFDKLFFSKLEGDFSGWNGKAFVRSSPSWDALDGIYWDGKTLEFKYGKYDFKCDISGDELNCFNEHGKKPEWRARKAPDGLQI